MQSEKTRINLCEDKECSEATVVIPQDIEDLVVKVELLKDRIQTLQVKREEKKLKKWMNGNDVCNTLNISTRTLQAYRDKGTLPYSQIGGKFFYKPDDVHTLLSNSKQKTNEKPAN